MSSSLDKLQLQTPIAILKIFMVYCMQFLSNIIYTEMILYECTFIFLYKKNSNEYAFNKCTLFVKPPVTNHLFYNEKSAHGENKQ
jgi:hypothetical protein